MSTSVVEKCRCLYPLETSATTLWPGCLWCGKPVPNIYRLPKVNR